MAFENTTNRWLFSIAFTAVLLGALEFGVRQFGFASGDVSPNWLNFKAVDSLIVYDDFHVNDDAILVANAANHQVYGLTVNNEGFNSPEFTQTDSTQPTLMLIGDSYTWGMSASPNDSAFANILRKASGVNVHNLGIPAADPVQYALVAERYIPQLKPDAVVLFFFVGNDILLHDRIPVPYENFYFFTNAGAILSEIDGVKFPDAETAYAHLMHDKYWLTGNRNALEWLVSKSAVLSRLYSVRFRWEEKQRWENAIHDVSLTASYLLRVRNAALAQGATFQLIVIPELRETDLSREAYREKYKALFHHPVLGPHISWPKVSEQHFVPYPDAHLNNSGHRVYANFLLDSLQLP